MTQCEARITPKGRWRSATECSRDERVVQVIVRGKFHSVPPEQVREKKARKR